MTTDDREVARLISQAGGRPDPGAGLTESVRVALEQEWRAALARRRALRTRGYWLAASLAAVAIAGSWTVLRRAPEPAPLFVGTIIGTRGSVLVAPRAGRTLIAAGDALVAGSRVEAGPLAVALLTVGSVGVRVGPDTVLGLEHPGEINLLRGKIYVDSGAAPDGNTLLVMTEFGRVTHVGTQYQIRVQPGEFMEAGVREGQLRVNALGHAQIVERGWGLRLFKDKTITRISMPSFDAQWQWVSDFVPEFSIEGRSLSAFLDWFARETGRTLVFVMPVRREHTDQTTLSGNIVGLTPLQALDAIVATTRFQCDLSVAGEIRVSIRPNGSATSSMKQHATSNTAAVLPP